MKNVEFEEEVTDWGAVIACVGLLFAVAFALVLVTVGVVVQQYYFDQGALEPMPWGTSAIIAAVDGAILTIMALSLHQGEFPTKTIKRRVKVTRCDNGK